MDGGGLYPVPMSESCFYSYNKASELFSLLIQLACLLDLDTLALVYHQAGTARQSPYWISDPARLSQCNAKPGEPIFESSSGCCLTVTEFKPPIISHKTFLLFWQKVV